MTAERCATLAANPAARRLSIASYCAKTYVPAGSAPIGLYSYAIPLPGACSIICAPFHTWENERTFERTNAEEHRRRPSKLAQLAYYS